MAAGVEALLCIEKHTAVHVAEETNTVRGGMESLGVDCDQY